MKSLPDCPYQIIVKPLPGARVTTHYALRQLLKRMRRDWGLQCLSIKPVSMPTVTPDASELSGNTDTAERNCDAS
jgi:hypothetical protein